MYKRTGNKQFTMQSCCEKSEDIVIGVRANNEGSETIFQTTPSEGRTFLDPRFGEDLNPMASHPCYNGMVLFRTLTTDSWGRINLWVGLQLGCWPLFMFSTKFTQGGYNSSYYTNAGVMEVMNQGSEIKA